MIRDRSRAAATSKMERSILDVAAALDPPLMILDLLTLYMILFLLFVQAKSSDLRYSMKKGVLQNFVKFTGKHLSRSLFLNKVADSNFIKNETLTQVFSCEFCEIFKSIFFIERLRWLFLTGHKIDRSTSLNCLFVHLRKILLYSL